MSKALIKHFVTGLGCIAISQGVAADNSSFDSPTDRFTMTGYGDVNYMDAEGGNSVFTSRFIPIFLYKLNDKIHIESEIEFGINEAGETETVMEYADLHYFLTDSTTITAGKFLLPFGQFGPNLHPSWINRLPSMPGVYGGHGGNGTLTPLMPILSDVGIGVQQTFKLGDDSRLFIDLYLTNGPQAEEGHGGEAAEEGHEEEEAEEGHEEAEEEAEVHVVSFPDVGFEAKNRDNNDSKALGGRIAYAWLPGLEVGASYYQGAYDGLGNLDFTATGIDVNYTSAYYAIRGEYIKTEAETLGEESDEKLELDRDGWYLQGSWQMRQLNIDYVNPVELVLRRSDINKIDAGERWTYGVNYWLSPSAALKMAYEDTSLEGGEDNSRFLTQLTFGF